MLFKYGAKLGDNPAVQVEPKYGAAFIGTNLTKVYDVKEGTYLLVSNGAIEAIYTSKEDAIEEARKRTLQNTRDYFVAEVLGRATTVVETTWKE